MTSSKSLAGSLTLSFVALFAMRPVAAATPLSVTLGAQFPTQNNAQNAGGDTQASLLVGYDVIHAPIVPIQASLTFDASQGTHGSGMLNELGFGVEGALTTPFYAGAGVSVENVNARPAYAGASNVTQLGLGTSIFVGDRVLSLPGGVNFSLQATYKQVAPVDGINPSSYGLGLRVHL